MTVLTDLELFPLRWSYPEPISDARATIRESQVLLVRLIDRRGITGWGEIACFGGVAGLAARVTREALWPRIANRDWGPRELAARLFAATAHYGQRGLVVSCISGLEIAAWDLLGRATGMPVSCLLGGRPRALPVYASTGYYTSADPTAEGDDLDDLRRQVADVDLARFSGVKIKIGRHGLDDDCSRVAAARETIGAGPWLIADANNAYDVRTARRLAERIRAHDVMFLEEPLPFGHPDVSQDLRSLSEVAIGGYELENRFDGFAPYLTSRPAVDYVQPDCCWSGGLAECLEIALQARRVGVEVIPHNFAGPIATAANAHMLWAAGAGAALEFNSTGTPLAEGILTEAGLPIEDGHLQPLNGPGLGVEPDPGKIERYLDRSDCGAAG